MERLSSFPHLRRLSLLFVAMAVVVSGCKRKPPPRDFSDAAAGISAKMPGIPTSRHRTEPTPIGLAEITTYSLETEWAEYSVVWSEFALQRLPVKPAWDVMAQQVGAGATSTDITKSGLRGKEFRGTDANGHPFWARGFIVGRRMFVVGYSPRTSDGDAAERLAFLDSFDIAPATIAALKALKVCAPYDCHTVTPEGGRFAIDLPVQPKPSDEEIQSSLGPFAVHVFTAQSLPVRMQIRYLDLSPSPDAPKPNVTEFAKVLAAASGGKTFRTREAQLANQAAVEVLVDEHADPTSDEVTGVARTILVGHRLYQVLIAYPPDELPAEEIEAYFGSFRPVTVDAAR